MRMIELIDKKKQGGCHEAGELRFIIQGCTTGEIPDYQLSAWLMAIWFQGLTTEETIALTLAMAESGVQLDLSTIDGVKVDKHSTGGVADTTTLIVTPLVAAAGVKIAKMSGRGLDFTGGTIDKLEAIPGLRTSLSAEEFIAQVQQVGMAIIGQTTDFAPADGRLYALRDVTATVDSIPLIAASIMSKKLAAGADKILLDVKYGSGAFMKTMAAAQELAKVMVDIGTGAGRETAAVVSSMEEPLGTVIGNSLEIMEAIEVLSGGGDKRLSDFGVILAAKMLQMAQPTLDVPTATTIIQRLLLSGAGLMKFKQFVAAQGGDNRIVADPALLGTALYSREVRSVRSGYIVRMDSAGLGRAAVLLGDGRAKKGDSIDLTAGIRLHRRCGETVLADELLATLFFSTKVESQNAVKLVSDSIQISEAPPPAEKLIAGIVDKNGWHEAKER
jgi:pyrimidine-nucleoside phosphorylase